jgi:hypothetical protein
MTRESFQTGIFQLGWNDLPAFAEVQIDLADRTVARLSAWWRAHYTRNGCAWGGSGAHYVTTDMKCSKVEIWDHPSEGGDGRPGLIHEYPLDEEQQEALSFADDPSDRWRTIAAVLEREGAIRRITSIDCSIVEDADNPALWEMVGQVGFWS